MPMVANFEKIDQLPKNTVEPATTWFTEGRSRAATPCCGSTGQILRFPSKCTHCHALTVVLCAAKRLLTGLLGSRRLACDWPRQSTLFPRMRCPSSGCRAPSLTSAHVAAEAVRAVRSSTTTKGPVFAGPLGRALLNDQPAASALQRLSPARRRQRPRHRGASWAIGAPTAGGVSAPGSRHCRSCAVAVGVGGVAAVGCTRCRTWCSGRCRRRSTPVSPSWFQRRSGSQTRGEPNRRTSES